MEIPEKFQHIKGVKAVNQHNVVLEGTFNISDLQNLQALILGSEENARNVLSCVLPMIVVDGDDSILQTIVCDSLGGKPYINGMPSRLSLLLRNDKGEETRAEYSQTVKTTTEQQTDEMAFFLKIKNLAASFTFNLLISLTPREEKVCRMIADGKTLDDIAVYFDVKPERINQILARAHRKINHSSRAHLWNNPSQTE